MKKIIATVVMLGAGVTALIWGQSASAKPAVPTVFSQAELKKLTAELMASSQKVAIGISAKPLIAAPMHAITLASRHTGIPELHENVHDIAIVQDGTGAMRIGGEIVDRKPLGGGQGEWTGSSIKGGETFTAGPGDVFYIPKGVAHMWEVSGDQQVTYLAIKVTEK